WATFLTRRADPATNGYTLSWYAASTKGGGVRRLADGGDPIQAVSLGRSVGFLQNVPASWSPDNQSIAILKRVRGHTQAWGLSVSGGEPKQLTHTEGDIRALAFSADGKRLLFQVEPSVEEIKADLAREGRDGFHYDNRFFPVYSPTPVLPTDI